MSNAPPHLHLEEATLKDWHVCEVSSLLELNILHQQPTNKASSLYFVDLDRGEWHKHIFRRYCSLKKMDTALFSVFSFLSCIAARACGLRESHVGLNGPGRIGRRRLQDQLVIYAGICWNCLLNYWLILVNFDFTTCLIHFIIFYAVLRG